MAFESFGYTAEAGEDLVPFLRQGHVTYEDLMRRIRRVQDEWIPGNPDSLELVIFFEGFYLTFVVSPRDSTRLVLAAVKPLPAT